MRLPFFGDKFALNNRSIHLLLSVNRELILQKIKKSKF
ncbi:hypothetical protein CLHUN_18750 [Ruminiclostridium hungatei]|uniref:Uncharacterized protein n=1 Tax=Ruminiclostridium hungatei TaxID=48256 RepID=A0A1V4SKD8_RUMHU|nr:hypothetical protein CLHUN_18750 [Ruminiclostridium hungatei]